MVDQLVTSGIKFKRIEDLLEIFDNHVFLRYYPHYNTTLATTEMIVGLSDPETAMKWVRILEFNPLIKLDARIRDALAKIEGLVASDQAKKDEFESLVKKL